MKANIVTRVILDSENHKVYLSIEGDIKSATEEEKIKARDTLVDAFSYIFGLSESVPPQTNIVDDFEVNEDFDEEEITRFLGNEASKQDEECTIEGPAEEASEIPANEAEEAEEVKEVVMGIGRYPNMTASQIISEHGEEGVKYLKYLLRILEKKLDKYPQNQERIDSINAALRRYEEKGGGGGDALDNRPHH